MSDTTPRFGIVIPNSADLGNWAGVLAQTFAQLETTVGVNSNLVLDGDDSQGAAGAGELAYLSGTSTFQASDPSDGRWGRAVLQEVLVDGQPALIRFMGITAIDGTVGSHGTAVFHASDSGEAVIDPADAIVAVGGRVHFLPIGMSLGGGSILMNGLIALQTCPIIAAAIPAFFQDGSGAPTLAGWTEVFSNVEKRHYWKSGFDGASQDDDIVFPFTLPADFGEFPDASGADFWGLRVEIRCENTSGSGYAGAQIVEFVDTAGVSFTSLGTALEQSTSWTTQSVSWQTLAGLGATLSPGGTVLMRVKTRGNNTDAVDVSNPSLHYFPIWRWN